MRLRSAPVRAARAAAVVVLLTLLAGCGPSLSTGGPSGGHDTPPPAATDPSGPTPVATDPGATEGASPPSRTDTAWGRIWDGLPTGFPTYPGARPTETGAGPASAILDAGTADPGAVMNFYRSALQGAGWITIASSGPREDGSRELASVGIHPACQLQITVAPLGGSTIVTILYGADCPFG